MKHFALTAAAALALLPMFTPGRAAAQTIGRRPVTPYQRPTFSPYLNMLRGGNPAVNYYGQVVPQRTMTLELQQQQRQLQQLQVQQAQPPQPPGAFGMTGPLTLGDQPLGGLPTTGHPVVFYNYGRYFPAMTGQSGGGGSLGGQTSSVGFRR